MPASANTCLFCQIVARQAAAQIVYETELVLAFKDAVPVAPTHVLVIPKKHIPMVSDACSDDAVLLGRVLLAGATVAEKLGVGSGYRLVFNNGVEGDSTSGMCTFTSSAVARCGGPQAERSLSIHGLRLPSRGSRATRSQPTLSKVVESATTAAPHVGPRDR